jgi:CubicO group peptidase (beta-lactamase class C family)
MNRKTHTLLMLLALILSLPACHGQAEYPAAKPEATGQAVKTLAGETVASGELEAFITQTMEKANVAGLSCAIINDGQIVYKQAFGFKDKRAGALNDTETIFGAASFSKTVFAYLVMLLAEEGTIDLDRPLYEYLPKPLPEYPAYSDLAGDDRYKQITGRMALSHSTGFPNSRFLTPENRLTFLFPPGTRHSYSGEGIDLLQMVVEEITGKDLETLARDKVFAPLGMRRTSYVWQDAFEANHARPHDEFGRPRELNRRVEADAAGSMVTTAEDYARFLVGILNATGQRKISVDEMLRPQIAITYEAMFGPGSRQETDRYRSINLSWGLGWGRFDSEHGRAFFHTGHDIGFQNYTVTYPDKGIGIVLLSNSDNFESVASEIVQQAIGDRHSPFDWLGYIPFDPSRVKTPPPEPVAVEVDPEILRTYAGAYRVSADTTIYVKLDEGRLYLSRDAEHWEQAYGESETRFFVQGDDTRFVFVKDADGKISGLNIEMQGLVIPAQKVD